MKILNKLTGGYLMISLIFMIVAIVGVITINDIKSAFDEIAEETIPLVEALENVKAIGLKMGLASTEFVLIRAETETNDVTFEEIEKDTVKSAIKEFDAAISRYEVLINKFYPDEKDTVESIKKSGAKFQSVSNEIIELKEQGASGKIVIEKWEEFEEAEEEFLKVIDNAITHKHDEVAARKQNIEQVIALSVDVILIVALFAFSIGIVLGVFNSKSISDPITRPKNAVEDISKGKMDTRVDIKSNDEVGILAAGFNKMAATLEQDVVERKKFDDALLQSYEIQYVLNSLLKLALEEKTLEDILKVTLDNIISIPWLAVESKGSIFLVEDEPEILVMKAQTGLSEIIQEKCSRVPFGRCLCGRAARTHEIQFSDRLDEKHDVFYEGMQPHGHYCVPILSAGRTLGVINLYLKDGHRREQQEETFLIAVADTLAGIIHRKRSESALKESEARFRATTQSANDAIISADGKGRIITWNDGARNIFGYTEEEALGKLLTMLMPEQFKSAYKNKLEVATLTGKTSLMGKTIELCGLGKDDVEFPIEITLSTWEIGKERFYSGIIRDLTDRKRAEDTLRESEERHRHLVNFSPYGIAIHSNSKIVYMNISAARILGSASPEHFIGKNVFDIIHPDNHNIVRERIRIQETGKVAAPIEEIFLRVDGTSVHVEVTSIPLRYEGKPAMYGVFKDITERKRHEELRLENIRLDEADKAKSEFLATMSHELRTPLSASIGFSELLKQGLAGELNEKQYRYVDNILVSNQFLLTLINDILDLSKIEAGKIELVIGRISLPVTIKETLSLIKEKAMKHNVLLKTEFDPELEFINVDKQRFKQIMFNLLNNAVKFSHEEGGTVTITTKKEGNMAQISVSDTGIGIREENISKLFHKFEQLEPVITSKYGGTGLGLAITKQLIEMHKGNIRVESRYGEGTTFTFSIPVER